MDRTTSYFLDSMQSIKTFKFKPNKLSKNGASTLLKYNCLIDKGDHR